MVQITAAVSRPHTLLYRQYSHLGFCGSTGGEGGRERGEGGRERGRGGERGRNREWGG